MEYEIKMDQESEKELLIRIPQAELNTYQEKEIDKLRKVVAIKGYRKGKVPRELIRTQYRDEIRSRALNEIITASYLKIMEEKNWQPASTVDLVDLKDGEEISCQLHFHIIPDFTVTDYRGLELIKEKPLPEEFLLEQGLEGLRDQFAEVREISIPAAVDNIVTADLEIIEENQPPQRQASIQIRIGDRNYPDEINRALVGSLKGQVKELTAGQKQYRITVKKVDERIRPALNDDFAVKLNFKNFDDLKARLLEDLKRREDQRIEEGLKENIAQILLERVNFTVPKNLIEEEYHKIIKKRDVPDSDSTREQFWDPAEKRVRFNLILDKISRLEKIETTDEEIATTVNALGITSNRENREEIEDYFRVMLTREKTIDFLYRHAQINEPGKIVSPKEAQDAHRSLRH